VDEADPLVGVANFDSAGGAFAFVCCLCAWWIFMYGPFARLIPPVETDSTPLPHSALMLASNNFPFTLPLGDLSGFLAPKVRDRREE
jgi:hypothetical protein